MCRSTKLWERLLEARLRYIPSIDNTQYGFRPGNSTTEPIFILPILQEKYREINKELHVVLVDFEKAYDRVSREFLYGDVSGGKVSLRGMLRLYEICTMTARLWYGLDQGILCTFTYKSDCIKDLH